MYINNKKNFSLLKILHLYLLSLHLSVGERYEVEYNNGATSRVYTLKR